MTSFIDDDGNSLDYNGKDFAITKQVISFYDFKIKGDVSVNIKFDNNAKNRKIFNFYGDNQLNKTVKKTFNLIQDGNKVNRGVVVIVSFDSEEIECFFMSGNASWFNLWDFNCNEIVTTKYDIELALGNAAQDRFDSWTATDGIVIPLVDWAMRGETHSPHVFNATGMWHFGDDSSVLSDDTPRIMLWVPCLYIHTLLKLLANHSGTNIGGNIFNDQFFKTVIVTPNNDDRWNTEVLQGLNRIVKPEHIAPEMKAVDLVKWVAVSFGCLVSFDNESNSVSIDIIDKIDKSNAVDWSEYFVSAEIQVSKYFDKSFIRYKKSNEINQAAYNLERETYYGDLLVRSDKEDGSKTEVYKSPFLPSYDIVGDAPLRWASPQTGFYETLDDQAYSFTSVSNVGDKAQFNGTGFPWATVTTQGLLLRIQGGIYDGFHLHATINSDNSVKWSSETPYKGNASGTLYTQTVKRISGHRVLSYVAGTTLSSVWQYPTWNFGTGSSATVGTAYFHKKTGIYSILNGYNQGLSYGEIDEDGRNDISLSEKYLLTLVNILKNPPIRGKFLLPKFVVDAFNFEYVYLKTKDMTGYYLVEKIENYRNAEDTVFVSLVKAD